RANPANPLLTSQLGASYAGMGSQYLTTQPARALAYFEQARTTSEGLVRTYPESLEYRMELALALHNAGEALRKLARRQEAVNAYEQAIEHEQKVLAQAPQMATARMFLRAHYLGLAGAYRELSRPAAAAEAIQKGQALTPAEATELYNIACEWAQ